MAQIELKPEWVLRLNKEEALLVLKALGGRVSGDEVEEAKALGDALTKQRASLAEDFGRKLAWHASKVDDGKEVKA